MKNIKHIVYLMLENRSFDHVLGWLYQNDKPNLFIPANTTPKIYNGLNTGNYYNQDANGNKFYATPVSDFLTSSVPTVDPHELYQHVNAQLFGQAANPAPNTMATMSGFVRDFQSVTPDQRGEIMQSYTLNSLPALNFLAGVYVYPMRITHRCLRKPIATGHLPARAIPSAT